MAKNINNLKANIKNNLIKKPHPWFLNKIKFIRRTSKPMATRANRWGSPTGIALFIFLLIGSFLYPQNEIQILKIRLLNNPYDLKNHLALAEKLLANNRFEQAEQALLLTQKISNFQFLPRSGIPLRGTVSNSEKNVLGEQSNSELQELWQKKHYADPKDIQRLIDAWEKIVEEKPNYRDGYLQLAILNYKIYKIEEAKEYLNKALAIDPNFEPARELKKIISLP